MSFPQDGRGTTTVWQRFVGLRLRTHDAVFDPDQCVLMDFDVDQSQGLRFAYVVPLSRTEALIENVYFADQDPDDAGHRGQLQEYLLARYGLMPSDYVIDGTERGVIPMTDADLRSPMSARRMAVGTGAGATRPSTGYAFLRIQRSARAAARAVARGRRPDLQLSTRRLRMLDAVFLRFMRDHPDRCPVVFERMFARTRPASLIRFLSDTSTLADEIRLIAALPVGWFLAAALRTIGTKARAHLHH
ncbi:lycopene cyclase family protein [Clavibacter sp. km1a]|uniref:lycopene cyclase family protein n=1 Tax=Clavibacter sp. km1a TaxID=3459136 RepID=UPI004042707D